MTYYADSSPVQWSTSRYLSWTVSGCPCLCKNQLCKNFRAEFNTAYLFCLSSPRLSSWNSLMSYLLLIGLYYLICGTDCKLLSLTYNTVQWFCNCWAPSGSSDRCVCAFQQVRSDAVFEEWWEVAYFYTCKLIISELILVSKPGHCVTLLGMEDLQELISQGIWD